MITHETTIAQAPNTDKLTDELMTALSLTRDNVGVSVASGRCFVTVPDGVTLEQVQPIVTAHNPATQTTAQQELAQANSAKTALKNLMNGLHSLSVNDKGYALYGRIFAATNNANQATIDAIVDRATAVAYITGLPEWQALTAVSKNFFAKELEANAGLCRVLLVVLTG